MYGYVPNYQTPAEPNPLAADAKTAAPRIRQTLADAGMPLIGQALKEIVDFMGYQTWSGDQKYLARLLVEVNTLIGVVAQQSTEAA
jgi:hypothetical protein